MLDPREEAMSAPSRNLTNYLGLGLVILGLVVVNGNLPLAIVRPRPPGLFLIGVGVALAFVATPLDVFLKGEVMAGGWHAVFWDILLVAIGVLVALASLIEWVWPGWVTGAMGRVGWGQFLAGAGALLAISAGIHLLDAVAARGSGWSILWTLPGMLVWGAILLLGLLLVGLGVVQLTAPDTLAAWMREIIPPMPAPLIPGG